MQVEPFYPWEQSPHTWINLRVLEPADFSPPSPSSEPDRSTIPVGSGWTFWGLPRQWASTCSLGESQNARLGQKKTTSSFSAEAGPCNALYGGGGGNVTSGFAEKLEMLFFQPKLPFWDPLRLQVDGHSLGRLQKSLQRQPECKSSLPLDSSGWAEFSSTQVWENCVEPNQWI